jgi:hypothetical protein
MLNLFEDTNPRELKELLGQIHAREAALPDFQRDFVWDPNATQELIASIRSATCVLRVVRRIAGDLDELSRAPDRWSVAEPPPRPPRLSQREARAQLRSKQDECPGHLRPVGGRVHAV